jgi:A/G-specific adenine glycosylase
MRASDAETIGRLQRRLLAWPDDDKKLRTMRDDAAYGTLATALVPRGRGSDFNQALLDFGATWCTARRPRRPACTMRRFCQTVSPCSARTQGPR